MVPVKSSIENTTATYYDAIRGPHITSCVDGDFNPTSKACVCSQL